jgi:hypothetical protein
VVEFVLAVLLIGGILFFFGGNRSPAAKAKEQEAAKFREAYQGWDTYLSPFNGTILATSRDKGRIVVGTLASYIERDLLALSSVSIEKDGQGLTVTNRGSQALGAAVGGILLGPMGFLVGGLSGSKTHKERVHQLALKVVIDDPDMPVHRITFFEVNAPGVGANDKRIRTIAEQMEHHYAVLSNAIRAQTKNGPNGEAAAPAIEPPTASVEDRLEKLWRLKDAGAISVEEFEQQKARLLG